MDRQSMFTRIVADNLAERLAVGALSGPDQPCVGETAFIRPDYPPQMEVGEALRELAGAVVQTVLSLAEAEQGDDPDWLYKRLQTEAMDLLAARPDLPGETVVRLATEMPRLVRLPALAKLAQQGMEVAPALVGEAPPDDEVIGGRSQSFAKVLADVKQVAVTDLAVLLQGESGTGKELMARRLHRLSPRREGPFVPLNCAALPENLIESELFGHEKGAFTGADEARRGYVRQAQGGTLFLDEIGETTKAFQVRLLRVLEDGVVSPLGSSQGERVDFRLICATHRDLDQAAAGGEFHQALLYRIKVVPIVLPPLRERSEDLPLLMGHFLRQACKLTKRDLALSPEAGRALMEYHWPGNVRELSHSLQRMAAMCPGDVVRLEDLPSEFLRHNTGSFLSRLKGLQGIPPGRVWGLAELLATAPGGVLVNSEVREHLGCSDSTAKNLLRVLSEAGLLQIKGTSKGRRYLVVHPEEN